MIAEKTIKLFEECIERDGGNTFRRNLGLVLPHIGDAYRDDEDGFRSHLGASLIGKTCGRELYYGFRWFLKVKFPGRVYRLFNRGHLEEGRLIALLLTAGIEVYQQDAKGNQFRISCYGGHFGGSGDGIGIGFPDLQTGEPALLEFKTHSDKSFQKLKKEGVKVSKPEHYIQMQMYLDKMNLSYAMYIACNKNDDEIHAEVVRKDEFTSHQFEERAGTIIFSKGIPRRISEKESWYECKFCDFHSICHKGAKVEMNCRTCMFSTPENDGKWYCRQTGEELDKQMQLDGCSEYQRIY